MFYLDRATSDEFFEVYKVNSIKKYYFQFIYIFKRMFYLSLMLLVKMLVKVRLLLLKLGKNLI
jgi:hypothetical protein